MAARETQPEFKSTGGKYESCALYFDANQAYNLEKKKKGCILWKYGHTQLKLELLALWHL